MSSSFARPVQVLREHITGLEAAITVCLADPAHKPVHKLRTETRRVGALLQLLEQIPDLPPHRKEADALQRNLRKLRRAAGAVRDLDVHRKMLESFAEAMAAPPPRDAEAAELAEHAEDTKDTKDAKDVAGPRAKGRKQGARSAPAAKDAGTAEDGMAADSGTPPEAAILSDSAEELRKRMGHERDKAATALQALLQDRQRKTTRAAEALLVALEPAAELSLPGTALLADAESLLARHDFARQGAIESLSEDELHTLRKSAKAARYVAESLPEDATLVSAAERFEALQEAGGEWHDALELARAARRYFGKGHTLTANYREQRKQKLAEYLHALRRSADVGDARKQTSSTKPARPKKRAGKGTTAAV